MRSFLIMCALVFSSCLAFAQVDEATERGASETIQKLLGEIRELKSKDAAASSYGIESFSKLFVTNARPLDRNCDPDNRPRPPEEREQRSCVKNCTLRYSDGSCGSYGSDFCGPRANCAARCTLRYSDGKCGSYAADFCGPKADCSEDCKLRYSDGKCGSYGPDVCY